MRELRAVNLLAALLQKNTIRQMGEIALASVTSGNRSEMVETSPLEGRVVVRVLGNELSRVGAILADQRAPWPPPLVDDSAQPFGVAVDSRIETLYQVRIDRRAVHLPHRRLIKLTPAQELLAQLDDAAQPLPCRIGNAQVRQYPSGDAVRLRQYSEQHMLAAKESVTATPRLL